MDLLRGRKDLTLDHILPRSRGGPDTADNAVMVCGSCNSNLIHIRCSPSLNTVGQLKKLLCYAAITLLLLSIGSGNSVFSNEKSDANQSRRSAIEDSTKIIVIGGMHVNPENPEPEDEFTLGFTIKNNSTVTAENLNVTINFPSQLELASGSKKILLGDVGPYQERYVSWRIRANASADCIIELDFETTNLGSSQSKWLLEVFPKFTSIFLDPLFQSLAIIGTATALVLLAVIIKRHHQGNKHPKH